MVHDDKVRRRPLTKPNFASLSWRWTDHVRVNLLKLGMVTLSSFLDHKVTMYIAISELALRSFV